jgi:hypothetical protein
MAYDAARKAATALLTHQGLRPTTAGGHIAVAEAVRAQFPGVPGLASLDRLRRRRNQADYPNLAATTPSTRTRSTTPSPSPTNASTAAGACSPWTNSGSSDPARVSPPAAARSRVAVAQARFLRSTP